MHTLAAAEATASAVAVLAALMDCDEVCTMTVTESALGNAQWQRHCQITFVDRNDCRGRPGSTARWMHRVRAGCPSAARRTFDALLHGACGCCGVA